MIAIDTSHSMAANDVPPTRLAAAQASARRFLAQLPDKYRVAVVAFSSRAQLVAPPTQNRAVRGFGTRSVARRAGHGARGCDRDVGQGRIGPAAGQKRAPASPRRRLPSWCSPTAPRTAGASSWRTREPGAQGEGARLHGGAGHAGGRRAGAAHRWLRRAHPGAAEPRRAPCRRRADGRALLRRPHAGGPHPGLCRSEVAPRQDAQERGDHGGVRGRRGALPARRGRTLRLWFRRVP